MTENINVLKLENGWFIDKDEELKGIELGWESQISQTAKEAFVPSIIQQFFPNHHGVAFYWCRFTPEISTLGTDKLFLHFEGVDYKATVWLNSAFLAEFEGPESPFDIDVTDILKIGEENLLSVRVVNPIDKDIDGLNTTNIPCRNKMLNRTAGAELNHGGIWYGVELRRKPQIFIEDKFLQGDIDSGVINIQLEINNCSNSCENARVKVKAFDPALHTNTVTANDFDFTVNYGLNIKEISIKVPNHKLWSTDEPNLYRIEITLETAFGEHSTSLNFGFRELVIKDGYFYLNRKKFFPKSAHSCSSYPIGQNLAIIEGQEYKDFIYAKSCGFNMLRAIAGGFRPEQLELCDEIGLLVLQECYAGWLLGVGPFEVGDEALLLERFDRCTSDMIRRDRNHPSVVMWGLLNETFDGIVFRRAVDYLKTARTLDPTRVVMLGSGRFDMDYTIGSISNPYSDKWEAQWGLDGLSEEEIVKLYGEKPFVDFGSYYNSGDYHYYPVAPITDEYINKFRHLGEGTRPVYFSEYGTGSLFHVIEEWRFFQQYGCDPDLEDSAFVEYQSRKLIEDWDKFGLKSVYPFPEMMLKESQRLSAKNRLFDLNMIRSNPRIAGHSLTGLLDHGMCGEGLWSYWRRMKPEIFDALTDGWAPLRFCLFVKQHVYSGEEIELEAVMANENVLPYGKYTADFAIMGECGVLESFSADFEIKDDSFAVPIIKRKVTLEAPTGKYSFVASLRQGGAPMGLKCDFYLTNKADIPAFNCKALGIGLKEETIAFLKGQGIEVTDFSQGDEGLVLVGENICKEDITRAVNAAENGARVLFVSSKYFGENKDDVALLKLPQDIKCSDYRDWLYHKECVMTHNTIFDGLGSGLCEFAKFGQTFPHIAFEGETVPDKIISPAFLTGYYTIPDSYASMHCACGFKSGKGELYLNCFDIENNIGKNPAADILLMNFIKFIEG